MTQKDSEDHSRPGEPREPADTNLTEEPNATPASPELDESTVAPAEPDVHPADSEPVLVEPLELEPPITRTAADIGSVQPAGAEFAEEMITVPEEPARPMLEPVTYVADLAPEITPRGWFDTSNVDEGAESLASTAAKTVPAFRSALSETEPSYQPEVEPEPQLEPDQEFDTEPHLEPAPQTAPEAEAALEPAVEPSEPELLPPEPPQPPPSAASEPAFSGEPIPRPESERREPQWQAPPVNTVFQTAPTQSDRFDLEDVGQTDDRWDRAKQMARTGLRYAGYAVAGYFALVFILILLYRFINPPASTLMVAQALTGTDVRQDWVSLDEISPALVRAVIVSEDWTFCEHYGIDIKAIEQAIERSGNGIPRGASTISMQTTKNLFLWNAKSYIRKIIELPLTLAIELVWPKHRILEIYLNVAEWGPGIFGAEAAAQYHFNKPASRLGEREAAQLAASLPNPIIREAGDPGPRTARKATVIQSRMRNAGDAAQCVLGARR